MNLALIRLLSVISDHKGGIATRRLREAVGTNACYDEINKAHDQGYISREQVRKPRGQKGNHLTVNRLTPQGRQVLETARLLGLV